MGLYAGIDIPVHLRGRDSRADGMADTSIRPENPVDIRPGSVRPAQRQLQQWQTCDQFHAGLTGISVQETASVGGNTITSDTYQLRQAIQQGPDNSQVMDSIRAAVMQAATDAEFQRTDMVGPRVSGDFVDMSILAVMLAGAGMLLYLWFRFENHFAVAAVITIALDLTKTLGFFALTGVEFNLTAVAALLALIGYSVNDKVVVFDRIRENLRAKPDQDFSQLVDRSISATLTRTVFTSVSTLVAILPMAIAGGSAVASFALPLLFGIVISTSSSIFIAAPIVLFLGKRRQNQGRSQLHEPMPLADPTP